MSGEQEHRREQDGKGDYNEPTTSGQPPALPAIEQAEATPPDSGGSAGGSRWRGRRGWSFQDHKVERDIRVQGNERETRVVNESKLLKAES